ncbi:glutamyl-tRNA(Gln) amidotransferase subunit A [Arenicella chitinivorans]|uniref:Glutamyl-tRNA(Gln) amidotransferase subunit A n=1 Tax=Arenicella chitinivorans TaxID=1329800 RepID=A0A918VR37_9GAMM|nr:Asp-tRNA(Asn)/Glu-tRNA(Gln) amidotransferase subunit GatA [Arenicella chitinivorans]GHA16097.1 glutamyl-tRNA(Gln) amidotransferase subunit A [Arenicella chitinivorans]
MTTLAQLSKLLASGELSSVELTQTYLDRIEQSNHNAFISTNTELALTAAKAADQRRADGDTNPLLGIPVAQKDIFCIEGMLTTCGSRILENFVAPYTATVVEKMHAHGLVTLGKANMDEFAMGSSNENSFFGGVANPWSAEEETLVPGGSSGGSAAAVAAHLAPAATGTDTGGSIRQPAAFCNLTGVKPTYGRCSRFGMIAFASSLDQAGPMTHTAEDAALLLNTMAGFDHRDATSLEVEAEDFTRSLDDSLAGIVIGVPKEFFSDGLDNEVATIIDAAIKQYQSLGAKIKEVSLPNSHLALPSYYVIAPAEASSNLSRFDGVRYGFRADEYTDLVDMYTKTRTQGFGDEVKRRIMIGTYALSSGYYDAYYAKAQKLRRLISNDFVAVFKDCDVLMGPTTPSPAFAAGTGGEDPVAMYMNDIYTIPANLAGLPAASIPAGFTQAGLPVGLHLIAPALQEAKMLNIAHQYQLVTDWHTRVAPTALGGSN